MEHFKSLSYDGFGINGRDEFRNRIATFAAGLSEEQRKEFGPLFAAAPELLDALKDVFKALLCPEPKTLKGWAQRNALIDQITRNALNKAEGSTL